MSVASNFGALLTDLADVKNITGAMSLKLDGTATGSTDDELLENLAGNLSFTLADGVYQGMDVWYEIRKAWALLKRTDAPARPESGTDADQSSRSRGQDQQRQIAHRAF